MDIPKTISSIFLVPTLGINREHLLENNFINGYVKDGQRETQYSECVYILFKPSNIHKFREFLIGEYDRTNTVLDDYNYDDDLVVVVYSLNPLYKKDYSLIYSGKYSKTSKAFQALFREKVTYVKDNITREEYSLQYRIFNKTKDLIQYWEKEFNINFTDDMEIWDGWFLEKETLDINKIKETLQCKP